MFPIINKVSNCVDCYRCLRKCTVKAISFRTGQAKINPDKCVLCGRCLHQCPQQTKTVYSYEAQIRQFMAQGPVALILGPAMISHFDRWTPAQLHAACQALGFAVVEEQAVHGAAYLQHCQEVLEDDECFYIASHCPVVINLVEIYYPKLIPHLLPLRSPAAFHSASLRRRYPGIKVVYASPCLARLDDLERDGLDAALTFTQLELMLRAVDAGEADETQTPPYQLIGETLALSGGLAQEMIAAQVLQHDEVRAYSGIRDCLENLEELERSNLEDLRGLRLLELMGCRGGCIGGLDLERRSSILKKNQDIHGRKQAHRLQPGWFEAPFGQKEMAAEFVDRAYFPKPVDPDEVKRILTKMRQATGQHKLLNCGACGYGSCYDKAVAVLRGDAELEMCMTLMRARAESTASSVMRNNPSAIIVFDREYIVREMNPAAERMFAAYDLEVGQPLFTCMDITNFAKVVETGIGIRDKVVPYEDLRLWTRQLIIRLQDDRGLYLALIADITEEEEKKRQMDQMRSELLEKANAVITNQMLVAQQIAGLLGETTADTKIILLNLIKEFEREKELE